MLVNLLTQLRGKAQQSAKCRSYLLVFTVFRSFESTDLHVIASDVLSGLECRVVKVG